MKQSEKSAAARQRILDAAMADFAANGYGGTSLNSICETHGISKGLLYHHFKDKDTVYLLCVKTCFDQLTLYLKEIAGSLHGPLEEQLSQYFDARLRFFAANPLCMGIFADAMFRPPAALAQQIRELRQPFDNLNLTILRDLLSGKPLRSGLDPDSLVEDFRMYVDFFNLCFQSSLNSGYSAHHAILEHEQKARRQIDILLHGIFA